MIKIALALLPVTGMTIALCGPAYAQVYKWTDEKGEVHYSDNSYDLKDAKGKGSLIIPAKKAAKEPEPEPDTQETGVPPTLDAGQGTQAEDQPVSPQTAGDSNATAQPGPEPKKEETAKAPAGQQPPAKPVKMSKRLLKAQKLEKSKSGSGQAPSTP